jgi:signal transduction histidine kinase
LATLKPIDDQTNRILLITRKVFIFNNKECFILSLNDIKSLKQVSALKTENNLLNLFTANVSHEMMTPLNCVIYFSDILIEFFKTDKVHRQQVKMIKHGANMIKFQVKDLLDRSLLEKNLLTPNFTTSNLNELIDETIEIMKV